MSTLRERRHRGERYAVTEAETGRPGMLELVCALPREVFEADARRQGVVAALLTLDHSNVLRVRHVGAQAGQLVVITEAPEGPNLFELLADKTPYDRRTAAAWRDQIAGAFAAAHEAGLQHDRLRAQDVFITSEHNVKVAGFGISQLRYDEDELDIPGFWMLSQAPEELAERRSRAVMGPERDRFLVDLLVGEMFAYAR